MIGIISDIHGNYVALKAVLSELDRMGVSKIICLGDIGGYYCQINECCEEIISRRIFSLLGNHDWYLVSGEDCPRSNSANRCLNYQRSVISDSNRKWLTTLKPHAQIGSLSIVHGGWRNPLDEYLVPSLEYFLGMNGKLFSSGHTHVPCIWASEGKAYCNPGSVGQPRDGDPRASFATLVEDSFFLHRVAYNVKILQEEMDRAGFPPYFYENLSNGVRIGGKIDSFKSTTIISRD